MDMNTQQMGDDSSINSLKRLDRAGSDNSRASKQLIDAAMQFGTRIVEIVEEAGLRGVELPRGYIVLIDQKYDEYKGYYVSDTCLLRSDGKAVNSAGREWYSTQFVHPDSNMGLYGWPKTTTTTAHAFAQDIASGLNDEIAAFIEKRKEENEQSARIIEQALERQAA